ncbi:hypothetical protein LF887_12595 [Chryseobacterium sp. MEBOG06]|uniref:hypothetical protein n=1 Tax=unclassified Chryseobacterium TaxID=2593645 RepID=UPI001F34A298|nr:MULTISPECIES: hypothetical protein [unclassified Chryseobacterium]UKB81850.1 hypothetical protein LF887_12595 [Chryseobacterium sp. MEBOG06]
MELDFRKLYVTKLFDFSKQEEELIFQVYDALLEMYDISVVNIEDSPYQKFSSETVDFLKEPKICYAVTDKDKRTEFYLFIINKISPSFRWVRTTDKYDTLEIWGLKKLSEDFGFISINKKKLTDKIAGIFSSFNINFKENRDFKDFYVLGSDPYKTMTFLNPERKKTIQSVADGSFSLEVKNDILSFGFPKTLSIDNALAISKFLEKI